MQLSARWRDSFLVLHAKLRLTEGRLGLRLGRGVLHAFARHRSLPVLVAPNPARVILRSRDYRIAGIVEGSREYVVLVALKRLHQLTGVGIPQPAGLIAACRDYLVALRIELDLADFALMAFEERRAGSSEDIIDTGHSVCGGSSELVTSVIEGRIKHLVIMTAEGLNASAAANIPQLACLVNRTSEAVLAGKVKLAA